MRILMLTNLYPPRVFGGYEIACRNVAVALRARGHVVEVLSSHSPIDAPGDPPWLHRVLTLRGFDPIWPASADGLALLRYEGACSQFPNTATLLSHLRRFRPDLVYAWHVGGIGGLALLDLVEQMRIPWVLHLMDDVPNLLLDGIAPLAASVFARADNALLTGARAISMSQKILDEISETVGVRFAVPPVIIPGWVDLRGVRHRDSYRQDGVLRLVTAGSLGPHKGIGLIIEACAQLQAAGHKAFEVDVFGFGRSEPWVAMAAQRGVAGRVRFLGARTQPQLMDLLPHYDAFLFPTHEREPFGFVPLEAAACGVVPVITRTAGCAERLVDGVHTLKIDRTAGSLAEAIARLLTGAADLAALGRRAARMVRQDLSFERCLDAIERVLEGARHQWDPRRLDDARLPALLYAKHLTGQFLTMHP